jgi:hypothetical protein
MVMYPATKAILMSGGMFLLACSHPATVSVEDKLESWRKGVWVSGAGTYAVYTNSHYFVVSNEGDSTSSNVYCGASQIQFHNKGIARQQVVRVRKFPGGELLLDHWPVLRDDDTETPMSIDTTLFVPGSCTVKGGIIYDAVTEIDDTSILLSTCNGDKERIFHNGRSVYLPADGGAFWSVRVESW